MDGEALAERLEAVENGLPMPAAAASATSGCDAGSSSVCTSPSLPRLGSGDKLKSSQTSPPGVWSSPVAKRKAESSSSVATGALSPREMAARAAIMRSQGSSSAVASGSGGSGVSRGHVPSLQRWVCVGVHRQPSQIYLWAGHKDITKIRTGNKFIRTECWISLTPCCFLNRNASVLVCLFSAVTFILLEKAARSQ